MDRVTALDLSMLQPILALSLSPRSSFDHIDPMVSTGTLSRRLDAPELSRIQLRRSLSESFPPTESVDLDEEELSTVITAASGRSSQGGQQYPITLPVTSAENYGWVLFEESNTKKWRKPRFTDPIVRYVERYCEQNGFNPYSKRAK